jgi:hypothetical protein
MSFFKNCLFVSHVADKFCQQILQKFENYYRKNAKTNNPSCYEHHHFESPKTSHILTAITEFHISEQRWVACLLTEMSKSFFQFFEIMH